MVVGYSSFMFNLLKAIMVLRGAWHFEAVAEGGFS